MKAVVAALGVLRALFFWLIFWHWLLPSTYKHTECKHTTPNMHTYACTSHIYTEVTPRFQCHKYLEDSYHIRSPQRSALFSSQSPSALQPCRYLELAQLTVGKRAGGVLFVDRCFAIEKFGFSWDSTERYKLCKQFKHIVWLGISFSGNNNTGRLISGWRISAEVINPLLKRIPDWITANRQCGHQLWGPMDPIAVPSRMHQLFLMLEAKQVRRETLYLCDRINLFLIHVYFGLKYLRSHEVTPP